MVATTSAGEKRPGRPVPPARPARAVARARAEAAAELHHHLVNLLNAVQGFAQAALLRLDRGGAPDPAYVRSTMARVDVVAGRALVLADELAALGRDGDPVGRLRCAPVDLVALAREAVAEQAGLTSQHEIALRSSVDCLIGWWDAARLRRALDNLLANSVKYSPGGGAITGALVLEDGPEAATARLSVTDEGVGIPSADLPRVCERFHRAANVAGRIEGTGVGLWTVHRTVQRHGGRVAVRSREGAGTTVTIWLPVEARR